MTDLILHIYDYFRHHRYMAVFSALSVAFLSLWGIFSIHYKEDISDFLPLDSKHQQALGIYQNIAGANRLFVIFGTDESFTSRIDDVTSRIADASSQSDADLMVEAVDAFSGHLKETDSLHMVRSLVTGIDMERIAATTDFVYQNIPYFLSESDYRRMDSLLSLPDYITRRLQADKQMLMFPVGGLLSDNISRDPLNLFTPVVQQLRQTDTAMNYELYDGCIFSPDMKRAIVMLTSPFGPSETRQNAQLLQLLHDTAREIEARYPRLDIRITGGPSIAVGNARQIKQDSILSISVSVVLIFLLLFVTLRRFRNMLLILLSIAWGWLFAMGALSLVNSEVSVIVIGISSVIIGIAVNYPLHLAIHLLHTRKMRHALREIVVPLVVGNVTTVGAFMALVPLESVALRDLGLFSSFLLIGTILFVLLFLPHLMKEQKRQAEEKSGGMMLNERTEGENREIMLNEQAAEKEMIPHSQSPEKVVLSSRWRQASVAALLLVTFVLGYFSLDTTFDTNMAHINYMTDEQKADMEYFSRMMDCQSGDETLYVVSSAASLDSALTLHQAKQPLLQQLVEQGDAKGLRGCGQFLVPEVEQKQRLVRWQQFSEKWSRTFAVQLPQEARQVGFQASAFEEFLNLFEPESPLEPQPVAYFAPLTEQVFSPYLSIDSLSGHYAVVDQLQVSSDQMPGVKSRLSDHFTFDVKSMNSAIATNMSGEFNYLGWICGAIVFFFLWFSLGSLELALLSFLPMAVSWIWILGLMSLFSIQFNIVNIILATFIFGQGDDYTIFITEGLCYEYATRRRMLDSYKHSIYVSALIMFIGIGSLILARHPALRSLAEVTIVGMSTVVLMACVLPPLVFKWLTAGRPRVLYLRPLLVMLYSFIIFNLQLVYVYLVGFIYIVITRPTEAKRHRLRKLVSRLYAWDLRHIPGVKYRVNNKVDNNKADNSKADNSKADHKKEYKPCVIIANHQSMLDTAILMSLSENTILVANQRASHNPMIRHLFRWLGHYELTSWDEIDWIYLRGQVARGRSLAVFPEGVRNPRSTILRFHKGAFLLAKELGLPLRPVLIHGANMVLPRGSWGIYAGEIRVEVDSAVMHAHDEDTKAFTRRMHQYFEQRYQTIAREAETYAYFASYVRDLYRYKGLEVEREARREILRVLKENSHREAERALRAEYALNAEHSLNAERALKAEKIFASCGIGVGPILYALTHPWEKVEAGEADAGKLAVALVASEGISNLVISKAEA